MAIDPKMYEKYSGRSGDPYQRMGEALAKSSAKTQQARAQRDKSFSERMVIGHLKANWMVSIIGSLLVLIALIAALFR